MDPPPLIFSVRPSFTPLGLILADDRSPDLAIFQLNGPKLGEFGDHHGFWLLVAGCWLMAAHSGLLMPGGPAWIKTGRNQKQGASNLRKFSTLFQRRTEPFQVIPLLVGQGQKNLFRLFPIYSALHFNV